MSVLSPLSSPKATQSRKNDFLLNAIWIPFRTFEIILISFDSMLGCIDIYIIYTYIYLHILKTLRVRFILFPLSDVGLKVPNQQFSGKSETPETESDVWRGKSSRKETSMFDDWRSGDDRYVSLLCKGCQIPTNSQVSLPTSFQQIFAPSIHIWQIFAILHSRKSATLCETRWAAAGSGAGARAPRRPSPEKRLQCRENRSKLLQKLLQNWEDLCHYVVVYLYCITVTCPRICAGKQTSPGFHHLRIQQVEVSDTIGVKALRIWAQSLDSFLHLHISKLELKCKFKPSVFLSECIFRFGDIWYDMSCLYVWYDTFEKVMTTFVKNIDSDETSSKWHSPWITEVGYKLHLQCHKWWASVPSHSPWRYLQDPLVVAGTQQCSP